MAYLVLENGSVFEGQRFGADGNTVGELVFTTGMVGYPETLTDPAFAGQIVMQTFPLVGNYGIIPEDIGDTCALHGYVVREHCEAPSNFRCEQTLTAFLKQQGVVGLCGIDTRELTRILRENGTMNACICDVIPADLSALKSYTVGKAMGVDKCTVYPAAPSAAYTVAVLDCGMRRSDIRALCERECEVTLYPADTEAATILSAQPDAVVITGGAGDPTADAARIATVGDLFGKVPLFGYGLGHQLIALSQGGTTAKLPHGHRGANQPVTEIGASHTHITAQNHGYVVSECPADAQLTFVNANDNTCEGLAYPDARCFTVQFEPTDAQWDALIRLMGGADNA